MRPGWEWWCWCGSSLLTFFLGESQFTILVSLGSSLRQQQKAHHHTTILHTSEHYQNDFGVLKDRPGAWSCPEWRTDETPYHSRYPIDERRSRSSDLSRQHTPICRDGHEQLVLHVSHFVQFVLDRDSFWELFCFAIKSLGRRVSGVESQRSAVRLHVHACSSSTLWWIIEMSSPNPHVSSGWRLVPDTLMFPVVGRVCRTRCCDVVVSVPMLLTCSGDEEGEWIDFETGIIYILKNFLYIMKIFPYLLKKTIFKQPIKAT